MLETIKKEIHECSQGLPFPEFYTEYVKSVQDGLIDKEISHLFNILGSNNINNIEEAVNILSSELEHI